MDETLDEVYESIEERTKTPEKTVFTGLSTKTKLWIGVSIGVIIILAYIGKLDMKLALLCITVVAIILLIIGWGDAGMQRYATDIECKFFVQKQLSWLQKKPLGEYGVDSDYVISPENKIKVTLPSREQQVDAKPWRRAVGFAIETPDGLQRNYFALVDARIPMRVMGFIEQLEGYRGKDPRDVRILASKDMYDRLRMMRMEGIYRGRHA